MIFQRDSLNGSRFDSPAELAWYRDSNVIPAVVCNPCRPRGLARARRTRRAALSREVFYCSRLDRDVARSSPYYAVSLPLKSETNLLDSCRLGIPRQSYCIVKSTPLAITFWEGCAA